MLQSATRKAWQIVALCNVPTRKCSRQSIYAQCGNAQRAWRNATPPHAGMALACKAQAVPHYLRFRLYNSLVVLLLSNMPPRAYSLRLRPASPRDSSRETEAEPGGLYHANRYRSPDDSITRTDFDLCPLLITRTDIDLCSPAHHANRYRRAESLGLSFSAQRGGTSGGEAPQPWRAMLADQRRYQPGPSPCCARALAADDVPGSLSGVARRAIPYEQHGDGPQRLHCGGPGGDGTLACDGHLSPVQVVGDAPLATYSMAPTVARRYSNFSARLFARAPEIGTPEPPRACARNRHPSPWDSALPAKILGLPHRGPGTELATLAQPPPQARPAWTRGASWGP